MKSYYWSKILITNFHWVILFEKSAIQFRAFAWPFFLVDLWQFCENRRRRNVNMNQGPPCMNAKKKKYQKQQKAQPRAHTKISTSSGGDIFKHTRMYERGRFLSQEWFMISYQVSALLEHHHGGMLWEVCNYTMKDRVDLHAHNCHNSFPFCVIFADILDTKIRTPPQEIVCYCLGDLNEARVRFQLAFLLLVSNHFGIPSSGRLVYDPVHTTIDRQILTTCGCTPLSFNENAERQVVVRTLFYMPFAPFNLTENVVRTNFKALERIYIIGNNLDFVWRLPSYRLKNASNDIAGDKPLQQCEMQGTIPTRAPSVHAALKMADETILWDADHSTWQTATVEETSKEAIYLKHCLNSTLVTFPNANNIDVHKLEHAPRSKL